MTRLLLVAVLALLTGPAAADEIVLAAEPLERNGTVEAVYRLDRPATGEGTLAIEWTDAYGRVVERREQPVAFENTTDATVALDLTRAVATANRLHARLSLPDDDTAHEAEAVFFVPPADRDWADYQVIMWQAQGPEQYRALRDIGVTAGMAYFVGEDAFFDTVDPLLETDLRWYVENIATDFYSTYHRWHPERPNNWRFLEVRELYAKDPLDVRALIRDPSLSDPEWLQKIRDRLSAAVRNYARFRPLFYNLADEPGIAQTAAFWDFDLSGHSLAGMRDWLRREYGDLAALNLQWGSSFAAWDEVMPMTTREAVMRTDDNFSAWADFKAWMDEAFARAIRTGAEAVRAADPAARAAVEGMQIPGWGGYDYTRLADSVDVMEIYDYGENVEIVRSLNPELIILGLSGGSGPGAEHGVWRDLLRGSRGVIFWDEKREIVRPDASLGERGRQAAAWIDKMRGGVGALLIGSERHYDPIAMLYSPASFRTNWMLEVKPLGQGWTARDVDSEYEDNAIRTSSRNFRWAIEHLGLQHRMVSPQQIEAGVLQQGYRVLILPHAISLSPQEAEQIRKFVGGGGMVIAEGDVGLFDEHSRRLREPLLADLFPDARPDGMQGATGGGGRAVRLSASRAREMRQLLAPTLAAAGVAPRYRLARRDGGIVDDVETYVFRNGGVTVLALQRDQLPPAGADTTEPIIVTLPAPSFVYDVLAGASRGRTDRLELTLDDAEPTILTLADAELQAPVAVLPKRLRLGETGWLRFSRPADPSAAFHVLHVEVTGPDGTLLRQYSDNVILREDETLRALPLALNDPTGTWRIAVTDVMSGQTTRSELEVVAP